MYVSLIYYVLFPTIYNESVGPEQSNVLEYISYKNDIFNLNRINFIYEFDRLENNNFNDNINNEIIEEDNEQRISSNDEINEVINFIYGGNNDGKILEEIEHITRMFTDTILNLTQLFYHNYIMFFLKRFHSVWGCS